MKVTIDFIDLVQAVIDFSHDRHKINLAHEDVRFHVAGIPLDVQEALTAEVIKKETA